MRKFVILGVALVLLTGGCSRKSDSSKLAIALPPSSVPSPHNRVQGKGISAFGAATLGHVVINVTGSGMTAPVLFTWDGHDKTGTPPTAFELTVPKGSDRVIQVLAVYKDDASGAMIFYYGDLKKTLSAANETADITVTALGGTAASVSGQIMGRYLTGESTGPTGALNIKFMPAVGRPEMLIEQSAIMNGWFSVFGLSNVAFRYEIASTGETMFGGPVSLNNPLFDPNANSGAEWLRRVRAAVPVSLRPDGDNNSTLKPEEAHYYVWGFWGNTAATTDAMWTTRSICKDSLSGSLSRMKKFNTTPANWASQPVLTVSNYINIGLTLPSDADLLNQVSPLGAATFLGGESGPCPTGRYTASDEFVKYLKISKTLIDGNGNDSAAGFRGPFRLNSMNSPFTVSTIGNRVLTGTVLPGIAEVVDTFYLYKKVGVDLEYRIESPDCSKLTDYGFTAAGTGTINGSGIMTLTSTISDADANAKTAAILCASKGGKVYTVGAFIQSWAFQNYGAGGGSSLPMATKLKLTFPASPGNLVYQQTCVPVRLSAVDNSGQPAVKDPNDNNLYMNYTVGNPQFATTPDCSTPMSFPFTLNAFNWTSGPEGSSYLLYYKNVGSGVSSGTLSMNTTMMAAYTATPVSLDDAPGSALYLRFADAPASIKAFQCYPIWAQSVVGATDTTAANFTPLTGITLNSTSNRIRFYDSGDCSTTEAPALSLGGSAYVITTGQKYFKYVDTTATATSLGATGLWSGANAVPVTYTASQIQVPGAATSIRLNMPTSIPFMGSCQPAYLDFVDASGNLAPVTNTMAGGSTATINIAGDSKVLFYGHSSCTGSTTTLSMTADGTQTGKQFWFKGTVSGAANVVASMGSYSGTLPVTIAAEVASQFVVVFPNQTWSAGNTFPTGPSVPLFTGRDYLVDVYAVKGSNFSVDTSYVSPGSTSFAFMPNQAFMVSNTLAPNSLSAPKFTLADAGHIQVWLRGDMAGTNLNFSQGNFMDTFGGLFPNFASNMNVYPDPFAYQANSQIVLWSGAGPGEASTANCQPHLLQTNRSIPNMPEAGGYGFFPSYPAQLPSGVPVLSSISSAGSVTFYSDPNCASTQVTASATLIPSGDSAKLIYVSASAPSGSYSPVFNVSGGYSNPVSFPFMILGSTAAGSFAGYEFMGAPNILENTCQSFAISAIDINARSVALPAAKTLTFSESSSLPGLSFYSDASCTTSLPSNQMSMSSGDRAKIFYVKVFGVNGTAGNDPGLVLRDIQVTDGTYTHVYPIRILDVSP